MTENSFSSLYYDSTTQKSQRRERHHVRFNNQRTLFSEVLQTDEQISCSEFYCGKLVIATNETGRVCILQGDFPRIRKQIQNILPPSDLHNPRLRNKWSCVDLWCHQEFLLVVQRDRDTRFTLISKFKVCIQGIVPDVVTWCMSRSGHVWYSLPNGSTYCLQDRRSFMGQKQVSHILPVLLEDGKEGLILVDCNNAILIDCASLTELSRVLVPDYSRVNIFCRRHSVDNQVVVVSLQLKDGNGVLYRLAVHKNTLLLDEYIFCFPQNCRKSNRVCCIFGCLCQQRRDCCLVVKQYQFL